MKIKQWFREKIIQWLELDSVIHQVNKNKVALHDNTEMCRDTRNSVNSQNVSISHFKGEIRDIVSGLSAIGIDAHFKGQSQIIVMSKAGGKDYVKIIDAEFDSYKHVIDSVKHLEASFGYRPNPVYFDHAPHISSELHHFYDDVQKKEGWK